MGYTGKAPLHIAADNKDYDMVEYLLSKGAEVDVLTTEYTDYPIEGAANTPIPEGLTPLFYAVMQGSTEVAELLLDNDADPNQNVANYYGYSSESGYYILDVALSSNNLEMIELLREHGAEESTLNTTGPYPYIPYY